MPRFFRRFAEGVFDLEDVQARAAQLASFVASASTEYGFAAANGYALGSSNGSELPNAVLLTWLLYTLYPADILTDLVLEVRRGL